MMVPPPPEGFWENGADHLFSGLELIIARCGPRGIVQICTRSQPLSLLRSARVSGFVPVATFGYCRSGHRQAGAATPPWR